MKKFLKFRYGQKGFTLIEVIIAIALTSIITGGITMTIFQVFDGYIRTSNHMIAIRQVQNAGYWISHDAQMAQIIEPAVDPDPDGFPLTLTWAEWKNTVNQVTYTIVDSELKRTHRSVSPEEPSTTVETVVAQCIDPEMTNCKFLGGVLSFQVTATVGSSSETRVYEITPRPDPSIRGKGVCFCKPGSSSELSGVEFPLFCLFY